MEGDDALGGGRYSKMPADDLGNGIDVGLPGPAGFDIEAGGFPEETRAACIAD